MNAVDTNVLVYAADSAEPDRQNQAVSLLSRLGNDPDQTVLLWQVAVEYLACLRRWELTGASPAKTRSCFWASLSRSSSVCFHRRAR